MTPDSDSQQAAGPFTDMVQQAFTLVWDVTSGNIPGDLHWQRLLLMTVFAIAIFVFYRGHGSKGADGRERKVGLLAFLLPKDIYTHVSARVDIWLCIRCLPCGQSIRSIILPKF